MNTIVGAGLIKEPGQLRQSEVSIGGTTWKPELPNYDTAKQTIAQILEEEPGQERALKMFVTLCRSQLFYDGNKRTAQIVANKMLIADGAGVLAIPVPHKREFENLLVDFYETGEEGKLVGFLDEKAMDGMALAAKEGSEKQANLEQEKQDCIAASRDSGLNTIYNERENAGRGR